MSIRVSIPLAGMDPASQQLRDERDRLGDEDRGFRMLSEGELFYVDTDLPQCGDERLLGACRHDHGHLGGVSLEEITQSMATRNPGKASLRKPESIAETEAASRSSSQDSSHNTDNSWQHQQRKGSNPVSNVRSGHQQQQQQQQQHQQRRQQQSPMFLKHKQGWDYSKLEAFLPGNDEGRERECSFSESNVRNCTRQLMLPTGEDYGCGPRRGGLKNPPDWSLSCIIGGSRVEVECLHLTSCTSTKTFEILPTDRESDALRRLGVVPDGFSSGVDGAGSMTFMMHIAGHRVVSTLLGRHAEYEVRLRGGGQSWSRWQRFTTFKPIAQCVDKDVASMKAWGRVIRAQPHFRCLDPEYLAQKCNLLEVFLQKVMYAIPSPALLIHFVSER